MIHALLIIGCLVIIVAILLVFSPQSIQKLNKVMNKKLFTDEDIYNNKITVSILFVAAGLLFIFTYFHVIL
jgi:hypothetical protein